MQVFYNIFINKLQISAGTMGYTSMHPKNVLELNDNKVFACNKVIKIIKGLLPFP
jgi:hypothetical protein